MKKNILIIIFALIVAGTFFWFFYYKPKITKINVPIQEINLQLKWTNQAQFAGNYVAVEKGFYADQSLKVNLIPYDFNSTVIDKVVSGKADFGIAAADQILLAREAGVPVKAIAVIYKITPAVAYSIKKSGISKPQDFIGKKVGLQKGSDVVYLYDAMLKKLDIDRTKIKEIPIGYDAKELINGTVDVATGYAINEPNFVVEQGQDINMMYMADYGVNMYSDVIFTTENLINTKPDLVSRFLTGTLNGWQYAISNENEAVDMTLKYAKDSTKIHQTYMLDSSIPLINNVNSRLGWMDLADWQKAIKILADEKILSKQVDANGAFTMQFLNDFYTNKYAI